MRRLENHRIGIDEGDVVLFSDFEHNGPMWAGEGARLVRKPITFSAPYLNPPSVQVGFSMWDISNTAVARMDLRAEDITSTGFALVFRTWGDTRIARIRANWRAIGELEDSDGWDLY